MTSKSTTSVEALGAHVLSTRFENIDQATIENAKNRIIDVVGCLIGGANDDGNADLVDLIKGWGGKEEASILAYGGKVPAQNAAMVNCVMARSFDFEPVVPVVDGVGLAAHISGTTVMTALTMGEAKDADGKELITTLLVGDDIASRTLAASGIDFAWGWDYIGMVNAFGATAISGRLLNLNERQIRNAFGIVLNQLAGSFQSIWDDTPCFKLLQGLAARNGIFSAELAKTGWIGPEDPLQSKHGYYALYTRGCVKPEILLKDLGKKYYADASIKPYPSCRGTHPAIDCALAIINKYPFEVEDIEEVIIHVAPRSLGTFYTKPFQIKDFPHACAIFSCHYTVSNALLRKSVRPEHFSEEAIRDPKINALISKVKLVGLEGAVPLSAKVEVRMKDGRVFSETTNAPKGDARNPMSRDEIIDKFWTNVNFSQRVSKGNAEKILKLLGGLEEVDSVKEIASLLVP